MYYRNSDNFGETVKAYGEQDGFDSLLRILWVLCVSRSFKAGVHVKAVLTSVNTAFLPISRSSNAKSLS